MYLARDPYFPNDVLANPDKEEDPLANEEEDHLEDEDNLQKVAESDDEGILEEVHDQELISTPSPSPPRPCYQPYRRH